MVCLKGLNGVSRALFHPDIDLNHPDRYQELGALTATVGVRLENRQSE